MSHKTTPLCVRAAVVLAASVLTLSSISAAQSDTGRITGSVTDTTGAAIPGATVKLTNIDTNAVDTRTSGGDGNFAFPALTRGHYKIGVHDDRLRAPGAEP